MQNKGQGLLNNIYLKLFRLLDCDIRVTDLEKDEK